MATGSSTVHSTTGLSWPISSPVTRPAVPTQEALPTGVPEVLDVQVDAVEEDPFAHQMLRRSTSSAGPTSPVFETIADETASSGSNKGTSEASIPLEPKEATRRGRPRKEHKKSGGSLEEDHATRRRGECDSNGEGEGK